MRIKIFFTVCLMVFSFALINAQTADEILNKYFAAVGIKKLAKVNTITITGKITGEALKKSTIDYLVKRVRPYKQYMELKNKDDISKSIFDGRSEWTISKGKTVKSPFDVEEQRKRSINFEGELHYCKNNGYIIEYSGISKIDGLDFHLIKVSNKDGYEAEFYFDPGSYMLMKTKNGEISTYYSNFKSFNGITLPYSLRVVTTTGNTTDLNIDSIEFDKEVDANLFVR